MRRLTDFRAIYMPYYLKREGSGRYFVLNREHKPVGFNTADWVDYEDFPVSVNITNLTPEIAEQLSIDGKRDLDTIVLYNDATSPAGDQVAMQAYLRRLAILAELMVVEP